jgi:hypothetical protein
MQIFGEYVYGFTAAMDGMRNPLDSWADSDSKICGMDYLDENYNTEGYVIGEKDMALAQKLVKNGSDHAKFMRQIQVWVDLILPRYLWSEFDTYSFNSKNSCSTMHKIHSKRFTQFDFQNPIPEFILDYLNSLLDKYNNGEYTKVEFIRTIKNVLPEGYLQLRTVNTNYAELLNIYKQRKNHRLLEWQKICDWIETLPYFKNFIEKL